MSVSSTQYCHYVEWVLARNRLRADQETGMFGDTICQDDQLAHMSYILRRVGIPAYRTVCRLSVPPYAPHPSMFITGLVIGEEVFGLYGERSWDALASVRPGYAEEKSRPGVVENATRYSDGDLLLSLPSADPVQQKIQAWIEAEIIQLQALLLDNQTAPVISAKRISRL